MRSHQSHLHATIKGFQIPSLHSMIPYSVNKSIEITYPLQIYLRKSSKKNKHEVLLRPRRLRRRPRRRFARSRRWWHRSASAKVRQHELPAGFALLQPLRPRRGRLHPRDAMPRLPVKNLGKVIGLGGSIGEDKCAVRMGHLGEFLSMQITRLKCKD